MMPSPSIVAGVLVGGKSTRMGRDKALLPWGDGTMVENAVAAARSVVAECVLLGRLNPVPPSLGECLQLPDAEPGLGPIGGLLSLLGHAPDRWCLLLGCDLPLVTPAVLQRLIGAIQPDATAVAYRTATGLEPACALYHGRLLSAVRLAVSRQRCALHDLFDAPSAVIIPADPGTVTALRNVNTPEDYGRMAGS